MAYTKTNFIDKVMGIIADAISNMEDELVTLDTKVMNHDTELMTHGDEIASIDTKLSNMPKLGYENTQLTTWKNRFESEYINVKDFGAIGDGTNDDTMAIQSAIDFCGRGVGRNIYIPSGIYKITSTLIIPGNTRLIGYSRNPGNTNENGTEIQWHGEDGGTAIITATPELGYGLDFQGSIENLRVSNVTATISGWGIKFRNAQNGAYLKNVLVKDFPTRQVIAYEENASSSGTCPGSAHIDNCFFIGGIIPFEIVCGTEQFNVTNTGIDTDVSSTMCILISPPDDFTITQRWACKLDSCKMEIAGDSADIPGIKVTVDAPITLINTTIQRNVNIMSTKPAIWYTNPDGRRLPTIEIINCTSWNLQKMYEATEAGLIISPVSITTGQSFSFKRENIDMVLVFNRSDLTANMSGAGVPYAGLSGLIESGGIVMPKKGMVTHMTARTNAKIATGSVNVQVVRNTNTIVNNITLDVSNQQDYNDFDTDNTFTVLNHFAEGDRIGVYADSNSNFAPTGSIDLTVGVYCRFY